MIAELSRKLAEISNSPYWKLEDPNGSKMRSRIERMEDETSVPKDVEEDFTTAIKSKDEPWRYIQILNGGVFPDAELYRREQFRLLANLAGNVQLVKVGIEGDGLLVARYQSGSGTHRTDAIAIELDAFLAQNQAPIEWIEKP